MTEDLRLRPGTPASTAIDNLSGLVIRARNIVGGAAGRNPRQYAGQYLSWAEDAERSVRHLFASPTVWQQFHTSRHEEIRRIDNRTARPVPLIIMETEAQADRLAAIVDRLRREQQAFEMPAGRVAVLPDTNVFIHYQRYDQIDWPAEIKAETVRLVVPLLVIDQLDEKS